MIIFLLAACLAQGDWGSIPARHDLAEDELSEARDVIARQLRARGLSGAIEVRRGEGGSVVLIEVATEDAQGRADTRRATWTRLAGEWPVPRPEEGWSEVSRERLDEAAARIADEGLRRHVLAVARQAWEQTARPHGQTVRLAVVPCRWVEYESDGRCHDAILVHDEWVETGSTPSASPVDTHPDDDGYDPVGDIRNLGLGASAIALLMILGLLIRKRAARTP